MSKRSQNLIFFWCLYIGLFGLILSGAAFQLTEPPIHLIMSMINSNAYELDNNLRFSLGVQGALTLCIAILVYAILKAEQHSALPNSIWQLILLALAVWFVVDGIISYVTGYAFNMLSNALILVWVTFPLWKEGKLKFSMQFVEQFLERFKHQQSETLLPSAHPQGSFNQDQGIKNTPLMREALVGEEDASLHDVIEVVVRPEHHGLVFILNKTYRPSMSPEELFEATRGVWLGVPRGSSLKFAYATYKGIVREVYKIEKWLPAGTQQYFFRDLKLGDAAVKNRWEFVGEIAEDDVRHLYLGKEIRKPRSYGQPFQEV